MCWCGVGGDGVRHWGGALVLRALADLATVAIVGGEREIGVEVSLTEVDRLVGVFEYLRGRQRQRGFLGTNGSGRNTQILELGNRTVQSGNTTNMISYK